MFSKPLAMLIFITLILSTGFSIPSRTIAQEKSRELAIRIELEGDGAVCNDGTPAVFYYRPGIAEYADDWIIHLNGGGGCTTIDECNRRFVTMPEFMSSSTYPDTAPLYGILSANPSMNPDFYQFNHVYVEYCSSDQWRGTQSASEETGEWHFEGHIIVQSLFETLLDGSLTNGHSLSTAENVLFSGSSAGANGVQHHLNFVKAMLPETVRLRGFIDSWWTPTNLEELDIPVANEGSAMLEQTMALQALYTEPLCLENSESAQGCTGEALFPYWTVDVFVFIDQSDHNFNRFTPAQIQLYKDTLVESLSTVSGAASPDEGIHGSLTNTPFNTLEINDMLYREIIANWFFERAGDVKAFAGY